MLIVEFLEKNIILGIVIFSLYFCFPSFKNSPENLITSIVNNL